MFFNVPKQFSRKKHTTVHPQAAILGGFAVFLACFSVDKKFTKCLHENLWSSDKLHQATCTAVHGLRMVDHLNSWPMWAFLGVAFIQGWHHVFSVHPDVQGENTSKGWEMSVAILEGNYYKSSANM